MRTLKYACLPGFVVISVFGWGCDSAAPAVNPVPVADTKVPDAGTDAAVVEPEAGPDAPIGPSLRQVSRREPFGKLELSNLMHDGDFELAGRDARQYPWLGIEGPYYRTGAICRSGLRCIEMPPGHYVAGMFMWPDTPAVEVTFYAEPASPEDCKGAVGAIVLLDGYGPEMRVAHDDQEPVDGWCRYVGLFDVPSNPGYKWWSLLLVTRDEATGPIVFDEVSMVAVSEERRLNSAKKALSLSLAEKRMVERARERLKALLPPNPPREPKPVDNPTGRRKR
jgi:hypothetical protein